MARFSPPSFGSGSPASAARSRISAISTRNSSCAANGSTRRPMSISSRCANSCRGRRRSQVGIAIGLLRAGYAGALAAWLAFTLPSALALVAVRLWHQFARRCARQRLAAWPESRRRRGRRQGRAGDDALAGSRPRTRNARGRRGRPGFGPADILWSGHCHRPRRRHRAVACSAACRRQIMPPCPIPSAGRWHAP